MKLIKSSKLKLQHFSPLANIQTSQHVSENQWSYFQKSQDVALPILCWASHKKEIKTELAIHKLFKVAIARLEYKIIGHNIKLSQPTRILMLMSIMSTWFLRPLYIPMKHSLEYINLIIPIIIITSGRHL